MNKRIKKMNDLTPKEMGRRKFLRATGVALGVAGGYLIIQGVESSLKNGRIMGLLEKIVENRDNSNFKKLQEYQIGTQYYTAKPFDSYSRIIGQDVKENPFLNKMDGSDLRKFYRDFLNEGKDMQIGSKYKIPVWKKE
jgi:hypothetical protein